MKRALGRGLDLLFDQEKVDALFKKALEYDENGHFIQAFHIYMKIGEMASPYTAKALNNAAVILAEHDFIEDAIELLERALEYDPDNIEAKENLMTLKGYGR